MQDKLSFKTVDNLRYDGPASIVLFLVALPLCIGIALASGAPVLSGLIAGVAGGIVAGSLSKSSLSVSGPAAGLSTIVFSSIQSLDSFSLFLTCVVVAGLFQIIFGFLKAGTIGHFFPIAVIKGMLAAIGLILILKQLPHAIGYDVDFEGDENFFQPDGQNTFSEILTAIQQLSPGAVVVSILSLAIFLFWERLNLKKTGWTAFLSAPLLVVALGVLLNLVFQRFIPYLVIKESHRVALPGFDDLQNITGMLSFPQFNGDRIMDIVWIGLTIAIVASLETLLSIEAIDKLDPYKRITPLNHELKSQGVANLISGLLGGVPVTAVIVRGSANIAAGARTKISAILHGVFLCIAVFTIPDLLRQIPLSCLAIILIAIGYKLTPPALYREIYGKGMNQFLPFLVTVAAILLSDILTGVFVGLLVSVFFVLRANFHTAVILVNRGNQYLIRFTKDVSFLHKSSLRMALEQVPANANLIIDSSKNNFVDADILETIDDYMKGAPSRNIIVELKKKQLS